MRLLLPTLLFLFLLSGSGAKAVDEVNAYGTSALYEAALFDRPAQARRLLKNGADPNFRTVSPQPTRNRGRTPLFAALAGDSPEITRMLLEHGADPTVILHENRTLLYSAVSKWSWNRINEPHKATQSQEIVRLLVEAGADPTIKRVDGVSPVSLVAGYRIPGLKYTRDHSSGWLHQLMLSHVDDPSKLDDTMKWQGKGCYGYEIERTDRKLSLIAQKVYGDADRWPELAKLNTISRDKPYRLGNCLKVFDVYW